MTYYVHKGKLKQKDEEEAFMSITDVAGYWLAAALILMLAELIIPGGIVFFLGLSALGVASGIYLELFTSWTSALTFWFISSLVLVLIGRSYVQKMVGGDSHVANTDEQLDMFGQDAIVEEDIGPAQQMGRIRYQDTSWSAVSDGRHIPKGTQVTIITQENITFVVAPKGHK